MSNISDSTPFTTDIPGDAPAPVLRTGQEVYWATGRRKTSVARVRLRAGSGIILVNNRPYEEYFPGKHNQEDVVVPFLATETAGRYDVLATVRGGGMTGQSGALRLGITRALIKADSGTEERLRAAGFTTRDARKRERDKYGQRGARARYQYSKR